MVVVTLMIDIHHSTIDITTNILLMVEVVWWVDTAMESAEAEAVEGGIEAVHRRQAQTIVITTETEIIGEVVEEVDVARAVRPLLVVGADGVNPWTTSTILTVAAMEAGAVIIEGDDHDPILPRRRPLRRRHLLHPVPTAVLVTVDVDPHGVDDEGLLPMIVLLAEELVEAAEAVEIIAVATMLVETVPVPVAVDEEEEVLLRHVPDREKARDETAVAVAVVGTVTTAAVVDVIAIEGKERHWTKKEPHIKILLLARLVQKLRRRRSS